MTGGRLLPRVAVVIPTYNGAALTHACVASLLESPPELCSWDVIVVDDGSDEDATGSLEGLPESARLVSLPENSGFAAACNAGAKAAGDCDHLVFLNNDTIPLAGWLDELVRAVEEHPEAAAAGAKLLFPNGIIQHAGVTVGQDRWPRHLYAGFPEEHPAPNRARAVLAVTAACLLIRRADFDALQGFDTAFHNGYEDIDLCLRLGERGRQIRYCPTSVVYHLESVTRWRDGPISTEHNDRLFDERWRAKLEPDDLRHYIEDGLLSFEYGPYYPMTLVVDPALAVIRRPGEDAGGLERLLGIRSQQVMEMLSQQTRVALRERSTRAPHPGPSRRPARSEPVVLRTGGVHRIGGAGADARVISLVLPVKNEAASLRELIPAVLAQDAQAAVEIVAVDSGSSDDTVDVLRAFDATIIQIEPADFDHGLTRNLAAEHAKGDALLFMNGRTRPVNDHWLAPLIATLDEDPEVAGVCSRVIAHPDADVLLKHELELELSGSATRERKQITDPPAYAAMPVQERRVFLNFHTVSALLRAEVFARIPFRSVRTIGEDLLWAREVLEGGWVLVHEPASLAYHSHAYGLRELFSRNVDDGIANREITGRTLEEADLRPSIEALVDRDWEYIGDLQLGPDERERWMREAFLRRVAQVLGQWVGVNGDELPPGMVSEFSRIEGARSRRG